jgi:predicted Fe-Mo cluster-binding NifX family protein
LWENSVSPVLDTCESLLVADIEEGRVVSKQNVSLAGFGSQHIAEIIAQHADILVCGALSRSMAANLASRGVTLYPWTMGDVEHLIQIFTDGKKPGPEFTMPGCKRNRFGMCERKGRYGWGKKHDTHKRMDDTIQKKGRNR